MKYKFYLSYEDFINQEKLTEYMQQSFSNALEIMTEEKRKIDRSKNIYIQINIPERKKSFLGIIWKKFFYVYLFFALPIIEWSVKRKLRSLNKKQ